MRKYLIFFVLFGVVSFSCKRTSLGIDDYIQWVEDPDNGLMQEKMIGNYNFSVQYKPVDYHLLQIYKPDGLNQFSDTQIDSLREIYENQFIFNFRIDRNDGSSVIMSSTNPMGVSDHFIFSAEKDFCLISAHDTIHPAGYHFERTYEVVPYMNMGLVFSVSDQFINDDGFSFVYDDVVFNTGKIKFKYKISQFQSIPTLKL